MIGDNIKNIRELKKMGLNELSRAAGVSASYLSAIEQNKKNNPSVKTLQKIAKALNVLSQEFFNMEPMSDEEETKMYEETFKENREDIIPEKFTDPNEARGYIELHKMFAFPGFDVYKMTDKDVLNFGNDLLDHAKMVGYKYKR
jgi:transcriptional regulator with XRE-family HTH domain